MPRMLSEYPHGTIAYQYGRSTNYTWAVVQENRRDGVVSRGGGVLSGGDGVDCRGDGVGSGGDGVDS